ncbi:pentatricopeptide repeat-containing protein At3g05340 [Magnolia sinica]|uniref:pentatricopeptide repeat-containing protein At3g05340 n=1 Tax=Magnolia sinica TaxID=86752 RepID=UPI002659FB37|nr:pentatricopeptide repeat-containing protein At3g05340 [Magnolia sinica]XP_058083102.1 pentatricopeptide repeat-containing protein At3g05340 [Magnolia sinica]XP_058083103.1 pentatricopeptide repeat-containing protein At3g05340 [Magnolia sinica]
MKAIWVRRLNPNPTKTLPTLKYISSTLNHVDLSTLLSICGREGHFFLGSSLHAFILKNPISSSFQNQTNQHDHLVVWNSLISMYSKCGDLSYARKVFDEMPLKDTVSWNSMISGSLSAGKFEAGFALFRRMRCSENFLFDRATLTSVLSACNGPQFLYVIMMMHSLVFINGFEREISVGNALVTGYFRCGCLGTARRVFDEMPERNIVTWTAVISGHAQGQLFKESLALFFEMRHWMMDANSLTYSSALVACSGLQALREGRLIHGLVLKSGFESDSCLESALMDMYSKCSNVEDACTIFKSSRELDGVAMTIMLVGLAQNGLEEDAVELFVLIMKARFEIDANMVSAVLGVFGVITSLALGKQLHSLVIKKRFGCNPFVANGLINMYSKCGEFRESLKVFNQMACRNSVSWNSMIAGFARHGHGLEVLRLYEEMKLEGVEPTDVTFLSLLHACSHVGSIERGMQLLESMSKVHGVRPRMEHYACVVDMLARAGYLEEARGFIERLPVEPGVSVWQALLGACSIYGNSEIGRYASDRLIQLAPQCSAAYVLMANIYSSEGRWAERARVIKKMKENGVKKETGMSWVEVEKRVHSFVVEDTSHPQIDLIYEVLDGLIAVMRDEGYVPDRRFVLYDLDVR